MKLIDILNAERVHVNTIKQLSNAPLPSGEVGRLFPRAGLDISTSGDGLISLYRGGDYISLSDVRAALTVLVSELGGRTSWDDHRII